MGDPVPVNVLRSLAGRPAAWPRVIGVISIRAVEAELELLVGFPVGALKEDPVLLVMSPVGALGKAPVMSWLPNRCGSVLFRFWPRASGCFRFASSKERCQEGHGACVAATGRSETVVPGTTGPDPENDELLGADVREVVVVPVFGGSVYAEVIGTCSGAQYWRRTTSALGKGCGGSPPTVGTIPPQRRGGGSGRGAGGARKAWGAFAFACGAVGTGGSGQFAEWWSLVCWRICAVPGRLSPRYPSESPPPAINSVSLRRVVPG